MVTFLVMIIYNLLSLIALAVAFPYFIVSRHRKEWLKRLGFPSFTTNNSIWFHAASVGEVNAVSPVVLELRRRYPEKQIVITTMTKTGLQTALKISDHLQCTLLPMDNLFTMLNFIKKIKPKTILIVETEFWPNLFLSAKLMNIPLYVVNGRISDDTFVSYKKSRVFWKGLWKVVKCVGAQSVRDLEKFNVLGFREVILTYNIKFAIFLETTSPAIIREKYSIQDTDFVITLGSSRPGEENLLVGITPELSENIPSLKLILAPRHLSRTEEVVKITKSLNFELLSRRTSARSNLIVDCYGILTDIYSISDIVLIGGSFADFGGHNPLEAAYFQKPILMGKYHYACRDSVNRLLEDEAILIVEPENLSQTILNLYSDSEYRKSLGINAKKTLKKNSQSIQLTIDMVKNSL